MLELNLIRIDGDTQSRVELQHEVVEEYSEAMAEGVEFPPVVVFFDGVSHWLADGFHRYFGATHAGMESIAADVRNGTQADAQLFSFSVNASHGLRRTRADKRKAVTGALQHPVSCKWSDRQIAKHCGVHHELVGKVRQELSGGNRQIDQQRTVTRNGTTYQQNTANIGKSPAAPAAREPQAEAIHKPLREIVSPEPSQRGCEDAEPAPAAGAPEPAATPPSAGPDASCRTQGLEEEVSNLRDALAAAREEVESAARVLDASDQVAQALKEAESARSLARGLQARVNSLMTQVADLKRKVAHWKKKAGG